MEYGSSNVDFGFFNKLVSSSPYPISCPIESQQLAGRGGNRTKVQGGVDCVPPNNHRTKSPVLTFISDINDIHTSFEG